MEWLIFWAVMAGIVALVANSKGLNGGLWFLYGLLIWPIALVHAIVTRPEAKKIEERALESGSSRKCPYCAELIKTEAKVCRFCGRDV